MKFKLDENLPVELAHDLRVFGHEADTVVEEGLSGSADEMVIQAAEREHRVLLTLDKGIADVRAGPGAGMRGIVLFRPGKCGRGAILEFARSALPTLLTLDLPSRLIVVTARGIRVR